MFKNFLILLFILCNVSFVFASTKKYTISVCTTSNMQNALTCKKRVLKSMSGEVFIVKQNYNRYFTYLNLYDSYQEAKNEMKNLSSYVKKQKAYIKQIDYEEKEELKEKVIETVMVKEESIAEVKEEKIKPKEIIPLASSLPLLEDLKLVSSYRFEEENTQENIKEQIEDSVKIEQMEEPKDLIVSKEEIQYVEELRQISMDEFDKENEKQKQIIKPKEEKKPKITVSQNIQNNLESKKYDVSDYEQLIIEVDSSTNYMTIKAKVDDKLEKIKNYRVSTGKDSVKKPFGVGKVSQISLNPVWYPTQETKKTFKKRGINLPSVVPPGHKYNYMGAAKINLTHIVDGKSTYRIHGTLNEKTIGTNESAGCIRMKNSEVVELANLINQFSSMRSLSDVKVVLK
ncbi:L,D-transpeptidase [Arcobacter aquimarinus]|uniref:Lipoprotein-anchoring transpeptidase, ErfK/SrfK family n=1 Tax=Arcobacter aquimarinus TaxID=1315211 RepID=A0AAE7B2B9_9BACT|nr:L,D-transpeptidase [Arcobacter aquimarinus]QKE25131.1 putative lipoprotein-anchoring transpeptidase, ErfK/SrfK family [Arcobacter aquimarinus]RXI36418.1 L,D-transpeptidase [Arcobacter aquimarinus]